MIGPSGAGLSCAGERRTECVGGQAGGSRSAVRAVLRGVRRETRIRFQGIEQMLNAQARDQLKELRFRAIGKPVPRSPAPTWTDGH